MRIQGVAMVYGSNFLGRKKRDVCCRAAPNDQQRSLPWLPWLRGDASIIAKVVLPALAENFEKW